MTVKLDKDHIDWLLKLVSSELLFMSEQTPDSVARLTRDRVESVTKALQDADE